ncbi:GNAT family N-acetyltransferase [Candidatus Woesearchaeota archaeon]|nr:GNAT family N-acetyltransferase [Candidatus Woesearchaeota archaeon]MBI2582336.1 GNAT family N-acetyltransferase [Candidatus Woesearchaeota archaeon]
MGLGDKILITDIDIQKINDSHKLIISNFKSYEKELIKFLIEDAIDNQNKKISTTYLWFYKPTKELVGYVSVMTDAINLRGELKEHFRQKDISFKSLPALKIGKLCVSDNYLGRGIGTLMIEFVIILSEKLGKDVGLRFITTDSKRNADPKRDPIHFYKKFGFEVLKQREIGTTPMYKDLIKE